MARPGGHRHPPGDGAASTGFGIRVVSARDTGGTRLRGGMLRSWRREILLVARASPARAEEWDRTNRAEAEPSTTVSPPDWAGESLYIEWLTLPPRFSRECEAVHSSLAFPPSKVCHGDTHLVLGGERWHGEPDSLAFRFAVVLALAVSVLVFMTLATPPNLASNSAAPLPPSEAIHRPQLLNLY